MSHQGYGGGYSPHQGYHPGGPAQPGPYGPPQQQPQYTKPMQPDQRQNYSHQQSQYSTAGSHHNTTVSSIARARAARPPPRFRPIMILIMVLSIGLIFVGLVMTIIAVWPGYTPVGGNPLKIAGPCLLGVGGLVFIIGIINICWNSTKEKERMYHQQRLLYAQSVSRSTLASQPAPATPTSKPSKSILKKGGSTSTYNGNTTHEGEPGHNSFSTNRSYERESASDSGSRGSTGPDAVRVDMNPDHQHHSRSHRGHKTRSYAAANQGYSPDQQPPNQKYNPGVPVTPVKYDTSLTGIAELSPANLPGITGSGITGAPDMSPYGGSSSTPYSCGPGGYQQASPTDYTQQAATPRRWGSGQQNVAYETDQYQQQNVSSVSRTYAQPHQVSQKQRCSNTSSTSGGRYQNAPIHPTDSSTEV